MFDIGFWELLVIAVLGLLVLGPERLPTAIRTVQGWIRTIKQVGNSVKNEVSEELRIHELHQNLKKAEEQGFKNLSPEIDESLNTLKEARDAVTNPFAESEKKSENTKTND